MRLTTPSTASTIIFRGSRNTRLNWPQVPIVPRRPLLKPPFPYRPFSMSDTKNWKQEPRVINKSTLSPNEAKWAELQKIQWTDQEGASRVWEAANRKTRSSTGVDAIAVAPILLHPKRPAQTLVIKQFRPPLDSFCIEFPAGLVDEGETVEDAALRELKEETGYSGKLISLTPVIGNDPGLTTANMQFAVVEVQLNEGDAVPEQHLDSGEFIQRFIVPLGELYNTLLDYSKEERVMVDARLFHFACGMQFARDNSTKYGLDVKT